jgi:hypothetical protein
MTGVLIEHISIMRSLVISLRLPFFFVEDESSVVVLFDFDVQMGCRICSTSLYIN